MVRVVGCHTGVLGSNPGGPKRFFPSGGSGNSLAPEYVQGVGLSGSSSGLYSVVVYAWLSKNKRGSAIPDECRTFRPRKMPKVDVSAISINCRLGCVQA